MRTSLLNRWEQVNRSAIARFTISAFAAQFIVTAGLLLYVQQVTMSPLLNQERQIVSDLRRELVAVDRADGRPALLATINDLNGGFDSHNVAVLLIGPDGQRVAGNLATWPKAIPMDTDWTLADVYRAGSPVPQTVAVATVRLHDGFGLMCGIVVKDTVRLTEIGQEALTTALILAIAMTSLIAFVLGRILAQKVSDIAATANAVADGDLSERVPTDGSGDAFDRLGGTINAMLERIHRLVSQLRLMTDGLAHDLKSPVTRLIATVEHAMVDCADEGTLTALDRVLQETQHLQSILSTAILISRTEAGLGGELTAMTDVSRFLKDIAELYGPVAEDSGFTLSVTGTTVGFYPLSRELLAQAIGNLIENAIKYAGGNRIELSAERAGATLILTVADNGVGIDAPSREMALRRFGRLDPARSKPGSGLGLSLVDAVCHLHHGEIMLEDNAPGLRVALLLRSGNLPRRA